MGYEDQKPLIFMVVLQFVYAGITLSTRASLLQGMSPRVFVVYRQALAALLVAPVAFFRSRKGGNTCSLGWKNFCLIFLVSLVGVTVNQNIYFEGLYLASSSIASAMGNLLPAITFVLAYIVGQEKINIRSLRSKAKFIGTIICVTGAISMVLLKGPKLLNKEFHSDPIHSILRLSKGGETWLLGCLLLFASNCCWSIWLILQAPVSKSYPDHLSLTAWMCFIAAWQSAIVAFFIEKDLDAWKLQTPLELGCLFFTAGASAISFFAQAWCICKRGPLFSAMFNPLSTVIVTFIAFTFFREELYIGSLLGAIAVIFGLYIVLWGKAKDHMINSDVEKKPEEEKINYTIVVDESTDKLSCRIDLEEPLLHKQTIDLKDDQKH
ncbi:unnamed protein product [Coffea canephora]|uniref:WAT1-related protein n=1 Tax=Coffea canephora TaxID=49390 RepID=A0A068U3Z2_COFCA|nr:unnamed protein product [Coffea canephora]